MRPTFEDFVSNITSKFSERINTPFVRTRGTPSGAELSPYSKWREFTYGYWTAAELIAREIYQNPSRDFLSLPLLFLYRHYAELEMKSFLRFRAQFVEVDGKIEQTHNVSWLWQLCSQELEERGLLEFDDVFVAIQKTMDYICEHDPRGDLFRYPDAGVPREYSNLSVDLETLIKGMHELDLVFDYYTNVFGA